MRDDLRVRTRARGPVSQPLSTRCHIWASDWGFRRHFPREPWVVATFHPHLSRKLGTPEDCNKKTHNTELTLHFRTHLSNGPKNTDTLHPQATMYAVRAHVYPFNIDFNFSVSRIILFFHAFLREKRFKLHNFLVILINSLTSSPTRLFFPFISWTLPEHRAISWHGWTPWLGGGGHFLVRTPLPSLKL